MFDANGWTDKFGYYYETKYDVRYHQDAYTITLFGVAHGVNERP